MFTNGKIVLGQSSDQVRVAKVSGTECFKSVVLPIGARSWRTLTNHSCAIIGVSSKATHNKPYWHAGTTGPGYITVPWGEVAAYPTARFLNPDFTRGWAGMWY